MSGSSGIQQIFKVNALVLLLMLVAVSASAEEVPFSLVIVPESRTKDSAWISSAKDSPRPFYVVLENRTSQSQNIFESWNSWGSGVISFQMTFPDGKKITVAKRPQVFTRNYPSIYVVPPQGRQVFPISLDEQWTLPTFNQAGQVAIKLKATYTVMKSDESRKFDVWTGKVASKEISVMLNHW